MRAFAALSAAIGKAFVRDRATLFFTFFFPVLFIVIFGTVFSGKGAAVQGVAVVGDVPAISQMSAPQRAQTEKYLSFKTGMDRQDAIAKVRKGDLSGAVVADGKSVLLYTSPADTVKANQVQGALQGLLAAANQRAAGTPAAYRLTQRSVDNESLKSIQYVTPGMTAFGISVGATFGAAMTLIEWRNKKVLRRLRLAPIGIGSIVGSRVAVSIVVAFIQLAVFMGVGSVLGLRLSGDWWAAVPLILAGTMAFMSIGLVIGAFVRSSEAGAAITNLVMLPMSFLSGAFLPLDSAPAWLRTVADILPLGWLVRGLSDVLVRGQSAASAVLPTLLLLGFALVLTTVAGRSFRWDNA